MAKLQLGFKAFDPHELLCHFMAVEAGLYKRENLQIELMDITFIPDTALPRQTFQTGCAAALFSAIRGAPQKVIFVATDKPMFWLYSADDIAGIEQLKNKSIATFPGVAPPHHFARIILRDSGLDPDTELTLLATRDDAARLGLLKSGNVVAAVLSSAIAPQKLEHSGFNKLCFFGDAIRIPTTGLAVDYSFLKREPGLAQAFVKVHKQSLKIIHQDIELVAKVLSTYFDVDARHARHTATLYRQYYTRDGITTEAIAQGAVDSLMDLQKIENSISWDRIYDFSYGN